MPSTHAKQWLRQLLRYRYSILLAQLKSQFPVTETQEELLQQRIFNMEWIDGAFNNKDK
jgi:hypothetical protein